MRGVYYTAQEMMADGYRQMRGGRMQEIGLWTIMGDIIGKHRRSRRAAEEDIKLEMQRTGG